MSAQIKATWYFKTWCYKRFSLTLLFLDVIKIFLSFPSQYHVCWPLLVNVFLHSVTLTRLANKYIFKMWYLSMLSRSTVLHQLLYTIIVTNCYVNIFLLNVRSQINIRISVLSYYRMALWHCIDCPVNKLSPRCDSWQFNDINVTPCRTLPPHLYI